MVNNSEATAIFIFLNDYDKRFSKKVVFFCCTLRVIDGIDMLWKD